jgi:3-isopropylmalate dehydrogenase
LSHRIAVVPGDGIGPEVTAEALKVAQAAGAGLETASYDLGASRYLATGEVLPDAVLEELRDFGRKCLRGCSSGACC